MPRIGIDTETYLILPEQGIVAPRLVCLTYCTEDGTVGLLTRDDAIAFMHALLDTPDVEFVAHHARFDFAVLAAADGTLLPKIMRAYDEDRVRCTMLREKLLALSRGELADEGDTGAKRNVKFSLAACVMRRFEVDLSEDKAIGKNGEKPWRLRYAELDGVPLEEWPQKAVEYALEDARWNLALFDAQTTELTEGGGQGNVIPDEFPQTRAAYWLYLMSVRGVRTEIASVNRLDRALRAEHGRIHALVRAADVMRAKMQKGELVWSKNMTALRGRVIAAYGGEGSAPVTKKGAVATDRDTLNKIVDKTVLRWVEDAEKRIVEQRHQQGLPDLEGDEYAALARELSHAAAENFGLDAEQVYNWMVLHAVGELSGVDKVLNTYVPVLLQGTQYPITSNFNELLASGRTSSTKPNLQNPPRKGGVRECFVPRPGYVFVFCDYSFVELCTLAQTCLDLFGWSSMADAINAGLDPHLDMAGSMLSIDYDEAVRRKKAGDKDIGEFRQLSKALNFGYPGGLGASKFCDYARAGYGVTVSETDARRRKEEWYRKWPEMRLYHQHFGGMGIGDQTFTVTQLPSGRVRGGLNFTAGCNTMFQGRAADGAKRAGWYITQETYLGYGTHWPDDGRPPSPLFGSRLCLFVHDEFIIEAPEGSIHEAANRLSDVMIIGMREVVPAVKIGTEFAAARRWYKGASAAYDENKRLIPWEPKAK
jgi:hypothetical protein